jgi:opacity protein-like surface antigen
MACPSRVLLSVTVAGVLSLVSALPARAQWYAAAYLGGNHTRSADVTISDPAESLSLTFHDVHFAAKPLASPQYYGVRVGWLAGRARRLGIEVEFVHAKVISDTSRVYAVTADPGTPVPAGAMNTTVQRYQMTHGLNFLLINFVARTPLGHGGSGPVAFVARAGAGPTFPHAESTVLGQPREQYEYAGLGLDVSAGLDIRLHHRWSAVTEYKLTFARPEITLAHGTGRTTAVTHQVSVGLAFGLSR